MTRLGLPLLIFVAAHLLFMKNAYAYLDPASISMFAQAVVAGAIGSMVALKLYWHKIRSYLSQSKQPHRQNDQDPVD